MNIWINEIEHLTLKLKLNIEYVTGIKNITIVKYLKTEIRNRAMC